MPMPWNVIARRCRWTRIIGMAALPWERNWPRPGILPKHKPNSSPASSFGLTRPALIWIWASPLPARAGLTLPNMNLKRPCGWNPAINRRRKRCIRVNQPARDGRERFRGGGLRNREFRGFRSSDQLGWFNKPPIFDLHLTKARDAIRGTVKVNPILLVNHSLQCGSQIRTHRWAYPCFKLQKCGPRCITLIQEDETMFPCTEAGF